MTSIFIFRRLLKMKNTLLTKVFISCHSGG
jgi:hypothetical protein